MDRRRFLAALGVAALAPAAARAELAPPAMRGTVDAAAEGVVAGSMLDTSRSFQNLLNQASRDDRTVFLNAGRYLVSNLVLPPRTRISGVPGATILMFAGDGHMISAENAELIALEGLVIDGNSQAIADYVGGLVHLAGCASVSIEDCTIRGSTKSGLSLERCAGRVTRSTFTTAHEAGIKAIESGGLSLADNVVTDCGNAGIRVWRWNPGDDGTLVTGNRIERIRADDGGTGENGNGINIFRAGGVIVANNRISDCAFTAVRANSADNVQITGNNCRNLGEIAIYSEFVFAGAVIANNIIDGAASGISIANFKEGGRMAAVSGNIVRNLTGKGPYPAEAPGFGVGIAVEADVAITGNVIDGAGRYGMMLGWGPYLRDVAATGNVIRGAPIGVAVSVVEGSGSAVISDNLISGATGGAVVGMRWRDPASGDLARAGAETFPHLTVERNRIG